METKILEMAFGSKKARSSRRGVGARKRASQRAQGKTQRAGPIPLTATQKATIVASHFQIIERQAQHGIQVLEDTIDHLVANIDALEEDRLQLRALDLELGLEIRNITPDAHKVVKPNGANAVAQLLHIRVDLLRPQVGAGLAWDVARKGGRKEGNKEIREKGEK